ncbi:MAG: hypothetical protein GY910_15925 [bacterium]|nr:hypothetical protein [Deltaproteobacteria bacterium]MCP4906463.1 hypothetical protein [bacterium]
MNPYTPRTQRLRKRSVGDGATADENLIGRRNLLDPLTIDPANSVLFDRLHPRATLQPYSGLLRVVDIAPSPHQPDRRREDLDRLEYLDIRAP